MSVRNSRSMVKAEKIKLPDPKHKHVQESEVQVAVEGLERMSNGDWFATVNLSLDYELVDGRRITLHQRVRIRGAQSGSLRRGPVPKNG